MRRLKWRTRQLLTVALALVTVKIGDLAVTAVFDVGEPAAIAVRQGQWSALGGLATDALLALSMLAGAALLLVAVVTLSRDAFFQLNVRLRADDNALAEVLVMGVSPPVYRPNPPQEAEARRALAALGARRAGAAIETIKSQITSEPEIADLIQHNWTPSLRVVRRHLGRLRHVVLVPSPQSFERAKDLGAMIEQAALVDGHALEIEIPFTEPSQCPENDDYRSLSEAFQKQLSRLRQRYGDLRHVCLDATAGTKMLSVAAATATLNQNSLFCYADTNSGEVAIWEARATHEPAIDLPV